MVGEDRYIENSTLFRTKKCNKKHEDEENYYNTSSLFYLPDIKGIKKILNTFDS